MPTFKQFCFLLNPVKQINCKCIPSKLNELIFTSSSLVRSQLIVEGLLPKKIILAVVSFLLGHADSS